MSSALTSFSLARQLCSRRTTTVASSLRCVGAGTRLLKPARRWQSTATAQQPVDGPPISQANRVEATMKRFWKKVDLEEISVDGEAHFVVKLDKRSLKTPGGNVLALPASKRLAASLVAHEWEKQEKLIKPHALPMTSIVSRAIDGLRDPETHAQVREALLKYLDTDTICFHEEHPPALVRLQAKHWEPLIQRIEKDYGVKINIIKSLFGAGQPPATKRILAAVIEDFDEWELAALERSVYSTKSFLAGFALVKGHLSVDDLANVAQVEVLSQIETWGEVEDSDLVRAVLVLEAATSRLEDIALASAANSSIVKPSTASGASSGPPPPPPGPQSSAPQQSQQAALGSRDAPRAVKAFSDMVLADTGDDAKLKRYLDLSEKVGGPVWDQAKLVRSLLETQRDIIYCATQCAKPSGTDLPTILKPLIDGLEAISKLKDANRAGPHRDLFEHLSAVADGAPAVGWVAAEGKPASVVSEAKDACQFFANRVIKVSQQGSDARGLGKELYRTLGGTTQGGKALDFKGSAGPAATSAGAPPAPGPPPPPPPPPPADFGSAAPSAKPAGGGVAAVFAQINQGEGITSGLRKVKKEEMTHKNPSLRAQGPVPAAPTSPGLAAGKKPLKPSKPTALAGKKPSKFALEGKKWVVEFYENDQSIVIEETEKDQSVNLFGCKNVVVQVRGKVNAVNMTNCTKTSILVDSVISSVAVANSPSFALEIKGTAPTIQVDSTDSGQIYLSKDALGVEIMTAKCSSINVSLPVEGEEHGVFEEKPIPEMLRTTVKDGKLSELQYRHPLRNEGGSYTPVEEIGAPQDDEFIGGFDPNKPLLAEASQHHQQASYSVPHPWPGAAVSFDGPVAMPSLPPAVPPKAPPPLPQRPIGPHLQVVCGPLLRYDTVSESKVWHGAVLLVTADEGSTYDPHPLLSIEWDPDKITGNLQGSLNSPSAVGPRTQKIVIPGHELYHHRGHSGTYTFWRFLLEIPLQPHEMSVRYSINRTAKIEFFVPGANQNMRWAAHSCNGFSAGINEADFRQPGFETGYDPVWCDLLNKHAEQPFHCMVGGGDQIYCDRLTNEPEMQGWLNTKTADGRIKFLLTDEMKMAIDRSAVFILIIIVTTSDVELSLAPTVQYLHAKNMLDDHDLIDGFGSYPDDLQTSPVFSTIGSRGYFWFLLFQLFVVDDIDGTLGQPGQHTFKSTIIGGDGAYIPHPGHSMLSYLGPQVYMLLMDARAERKKEQVCSKFTYDRIFAEIQKLPPTVEHLVFLLGIPIAYPRMNFLEKTLDSKINPLVMLGKTGTMAVTGFLNKFNADVHCAAVGAFKSLHGGSRFMPVLTPERDHRYMLNVVTSAIVNTPPPVGVLKMVNQLSSKVHKTMHGQETDEIMLPLFTTAPDGTPSKSKYIYGARNWTKVIWNEQTGELEFDLRLEKEKGGGVTVGYVISTAACYAQYQWMSNSRNQDPCVVAAYLQAQCTPNETFTVIGLHGEGPYNPPPSDAANLCRCNSVVYSLLSACSICQGGNTNSWSEWTENCSSAAAQDGYPQVVPFQVIIPRWAETLPSETGGTFNVTYAKAVSARQAPSAEHKKLSVRTIIAIVLSILGAILLIVAGFAVYQFKKPRKATASAKARPRQDDEEQFNSLRKSLELSLSGFSDAGGHRYSRVSLTADHEDSSCGAAL
ncbi:hypothetical protein FS837_011957 [Tulasnella sp. UAMH 9824]|nr:hypothetical protein FS837_011957 [Tulasnella sp. UAMH 9824]